MQWRSARVWGRVVPALVAMVVASCSTNESTGPQIATVTVVSGSGQTGPIGGLLANPLVVRVEDQEHNAIAGAVITWQVTSGNGVVSPSEDTTDADGTAQTTFRLGSSVGVQTVSASLAGLSPVSFTASAISAPASQISLVTGDGQSGKVGSTLGTALTVKVTDAFSNPKAAVPVSFTVLTGGGTLSATSALSDANGTASVVWTLGTIAGIQTVVAGTGTLTPVTFSATADPDAPVQIIVVSGDAQTGAPGTTLPDSVVVRVVDQYGNGTPGQTVDWVLGPNDGSVSPTSSLSDASGRAATRWTLGLTGGPKSLTAKSDLIQKQVSGAALVSYTAITAGGRHTCGLALGGVVYCWGFNGDGELGIGAVAGGSGPIFSAPMPTGTVGNQTFRDVSAGTGHTCAVVLTGEAYCWGTNVDGRIGQESHTNDKFTSPVQVHTTYTFVSVDAGRASTCGIGFSSRPVCWGSNHEGEIGVVDGGVITVDSATIDFPQYVHNPVYSAGSVSISAGGVHACSVSPAGNAYCWGSNLYGQLGDGTTNRATSPIAVTGGLFFTRIAAGGYHTCALDGAGAAFCWGLNQNGQLGNGTPGNTTAPVAVAGGVAFVQISAGASHTCGRTAAGAVWCWGQNAYGQLGDGSTTDRSAPVLVGGGLVFASISAGESHTCGVTTANVAYCWGDNEFGALGDGSVVNRVFPTKVRFQP